MPNAIITSTTFSADGTQASIMNQLNTAMLAAGFTQIDSFVTVGNEQRVWQFDADPADALYGKMIIHGGFSATTTLRVRGYSSYTPATDSGLNESTTVTTGAAALNSTYTLYICNHPEVRGVIMMEGTTFRKFFGYLRPSVKPPAWGDFTYGFIDSGASSYVSSSLQTISSLRPASVGALCNAVGYINNTTPNLEIWNGRPFITNCLLSDNTNVKPIAFFSNDIISVGMTGMNILNEFFNPITNATYTIFDVPGATSRMAIKTGGA